MEVLLLHSIYQQQFRQDLKELLSKEFNLKEEKDIGQNLFNYFGFKGRIKDIRSLRRRINDLVEDNYSFDNDEKMLLYFVDDKEKEKPKLRKKRLM
jgi:hypothetical protein